MSKNTTPDEHLIAVRSQLAKIYDNEVPPLEGIKAAQKNFEAYCASARCDDERIKYLRDALARGLDVSLDIQEIEKFIAESTNERLSRIVRATLASKISQREQYTGYALETTRELQPPRQKENPGQGKGNNR